MKREPLILVGVRLRVRDVAAMKKIAARRFVGYQAMLRAWVAERTEVESQKIRPRTPSGPHA